MLSDSTSGGLMTHIVHLYLEAAAAAVSQDPPGTRRYQEHLHREMAHRLGNRIAQQN